MPIAARSAQSIEAESLRLRCEQEREQRQQKAQAERCFAVADYAQHMMDKERNDRVAAAAARKKEQADKKLAKLKASASFPLRPQSATTAWELAQRGNAPVRPLLVHHQRWRLI
jgi:hypothetical protein